MFFGSKKKYINGWTYLQSYSQIKIVNCTFFSESIKNLNLNLNCFYKTIDENMFQPDVLEWRQLFHLKISTNILKKK